MAAAACSGTVSGAVRPFSRGERACVPIRRRRALRRTARAAMRTRNELARTRRRTALAAQVSRALAVWRLCVAVCAQQERSASLAIALHAEQSSSVEGLASSQAERRAWGVMTATCVQACAALREQLGRRARAEVRRQAATSLIAARHVPRGLGDRGSMRQHGQEPLTAARSGRRSRSRENPRWAFHPSYLPRSRASAGLSAATAAPAPSNSASADDWCGSSTRNRARESACSGRAMWS